MGKLISAFMGKILKFEWIIDNLGKIIFLFSAQNEKSFERKKGHG